MRAKNGEQKMNESSMAEKVTGIHGLVDHGEDGEEEVKTTPRPSLGWLLQMVMSISKMGTPEEE